MCCLEKEDRKSLRSLGFSLLILLVSGTSGEGVQVPIWGQWGTGLFTGVLSRSPGFETSDPTVTSGGLKILSVEVIVPFHVSWKDEGNPRRKSGPVGYIPDESPPLNPSKSTTSPSPATTMSE